MAKFKVGDEVAVAAIMKIAAIQPQSNGTVSYSTDRGITIPEHLMEQIALSPKEQKAEEHKPAPQPAHRFKVGDRVGEIYAGYGDGTVINFRDDDVQPLYQVEFDDSTIWIPERRLSPATAPEPPKLYTGKVFALKPDCTDGSSGMLNRIGRVFEIKNGELQGETLKYDMSGYVQIKSFSDFCRLACATVWCEVKE